MIAVPLIDPVRVLQHPSSTPSSHPRLVFIQVKDEENSVPGAFASDSAANMLLLSYLITF